MINFPDAGIIESVDCFLLNKHNVIILKPLPQKQEQLHPNCGYIVIAIVMCYWIKKGYRKRYYPAQPEDVKLVYHQSLYEFRCPLGINQETYTMIFEGLFNAEYVALIARTAGWLGKLYSFDSLEKMREIIETCLNAGFPMAISFDVNAQHCPYVANGERAHWGLIIGQFQFNESIYYIITHGHDVYIYCKDSLLFESCSNLKSYKYYSLQLKKKMVLIAPSELRNHKIFNMLEEISIDNDGIIWRPRTDIYNQHVILENIARYLSWSDVLKLRLACKAYNLIIFGDGISFGLIKHRWGFRCGFSTSGFCMLGDGFFGLMKGYMGVVIWNWKAGKRIKVVKVRKDRVGIEKLVPLVSPFLAVEYSDGKIIIWNWQEGEQQGDGLETYSRGKTKDLVLLDHKFLASVLWNKSVKIWNWNTCQLIKKMDVSFESQSQVNCLVALGPDILAIGNSEGRIIIFRWETEEIIYKLTWRNDDISRLIKLDSNILVIVYSTGMVAILDWRSTRWGGKNLKSKMHRGDNGLIGDLILLDTNTLAFVSSRNTVTIWNWRTNKCEAFYIVGFEILDLKLADNDILTLLSRHNDLIEVRFYEIVRKNGKLLIQPKVIP